MNNLFKSYKDIENKNIENGLIKNIDINVVGHFGNIITFDIPIDFGHCFCYFLSNYNFTKGSGYVIRILFELLELTEDEGIKLSSLKDVPCRIVLKNNEIIGIGHFMKDKFLFVEDLINYLKTIS